MELKIEYLSTDDLQPYENNARKHADEDVDAIAASIRQFGFDDPIGIWSEDNLIVEGHGRLLAAKKLGMKTVPCIRLDHLTDEERRAYALAHNRTAELSGWDFDVRDEELARIGSIDMTEFGFEKKAFTEYAELKGSMKEKYLVPPFSIIYANKPDWFERKRAWVAKGLRSELGRDAKAYCDEKLISRQKAYGNIIQK